MFESFLLARYTVVECRVDGFLTLLMIVVQFEFQKITVKKYLKNNGR